MQTETNTIKGEQSILSTIGDLRENLNNNGDTLVSEDNVNEFISFLESKEQYLDTGLGAFHTDDHSNW